MRVIKNIFGFKTLNCVLERPSQVETLKKHFSRIQFLSYEPLVLDDFYCRQKLTTVIDLTLGETEVFQRFNKTCRNEIRQSAKIPELSFIGQQDFVPAAAYAVYAQHEYAQQRVPERVAEFKGCHFFYAQYQGVVIATVTVYETEQYLRVKTISSLRLDSAPAIIKIISLASRSLIWEICRYGLAHKKRGVDLAGVNLVEEAKQGITQFKLSFGGGMVPEYTYIYKSRFFRAAEKMVGIRLFWKRFFYTWLKKI